MPLNLPVKPEFQHLFCTEQIIHMESLEKEAIRKSTTRLTEDLEPTNIIDYLYEQGHITEDDYEEINNIKQRIVQVRKLLNCVKRDGTFEGFISSLRYQESYPWLADLLELRLDEIKSEDKPVAKELPEGVTSRKRRPGGPLDLGHEQASTPNAEGPQVACQSEQSGHQSAQQVLEYAITPIVCPPKKIRVDDGKRKFLTRLLTHLNNLVYAGGDEFKTVCQTLRTKNTNLDPDIEYVILDAEINFKRVTYDKSSSDHIFDKMEGLIPRTENPTACSMNFLARKGSSMAMQGRYEEALLLLDDAKRHILKVEACRHTGFILYIEINLLSQLYEETNQPRFKEKMMESIKMAVDHFQQESERHTKEQYLRMIYIKMAFGHLDIGTFGKEMNPGKKLKSDEQNIAKNCLDLVDIHWENIDNRRKMFYFIGRSVLFKHIGKHPDFISAKAKAKEFSTKAKKLAEKHNFKKELPNITQLDQMLHDDLATHDQIDTDSILKEMEAFTGPKPHADVQDLISLLSHTRISSGS